jgi:hypothetical protein
MEARKQRKYSHLGRLLAKQSSHPVQAPLETNVWLCKDCSRNQKQDYPFRSPNFSMRLFSARIPRVHQRLARKLSLVTSRS